jgi:hypothetical protein
MTILYEWLRGGNRWCGIEARQLRRRRFGIFSWSATCWMVEVGKLEA